jgi:hypothetical protein
MQTLKALAHHLISNDLARLTSDYVCPADTPFLTIVEHGHYELVADHIARNTNNWTLGLHNACKFGYPAIVDLMIAHGAACWDYGLLGACKGDQPQFIQLMIGYGATDRHDGLSHACRAGYFECAALLITLYAKRQAVNRMYNACVGGNPKIIDLIIAHGGTNWDRGLAGACEGGHLSIARDMIARGATNWDECLGIACQFGHYALIDLMLSKTRHRPD